MNSEKPLSRKQIACAAFLFALIFIAYTYPLVTEFTTHMIGDKRGGDPAQYTWNSYIFKQNLINGRDLFYTNFIYYPAGTNLWFHTYTPLISIFSLPFNNLFLALNIMTFMQFVLSGIGALLLSQRIFKNYTWGLIVGFVFTFSTYKTMHLLGHYHLMLTATIPFYIMTLMDSFAFSEKAHLPFVVNRKKLAWGIVLLLLTFLSDYYATFYLLFFSGFYLLFPIVRNYFLSLSKVYKWVSILALFTCGHVAAKIMELRGVYDRGAFWWLSDFTYFFVPAPRSIWLKTASFYKYVDSEGGANIEVPIFLGWTLILAFIYLAVLCIKHKMKHPPVVYFFIFILLFFVAMVIPQLKVFGVRLFYLPTAIYYYIPFLNNIRIPGRAALMVFLFFPLVLGYLWTCYKSYIPQRIYSYMPIAFLVLLMLEFTPRPFNFMDKDLNVEVSEWIKTKPGEVIFPVPLGLEDGMINYGKPDVGLMTDQITHGKKLLGGYASRVHDDVFALYTNDSIFQTLRILQKESLDTTILQRDVNKVDPAIVQKFLQTFSPDLILIEPHFKNTTVHRFVTLNFQPYIVAEDSLNGNILYTLKRP